VEEVDWSHRNDYIRERHGVEADWADEALSDPDALQIDPDPSSLSGRSVRTIGYSPTAADLLTVITLTEGDVTYGVNAWRSNDTDRRRYREGLE
jgi:uncharacterized DUF497 family protein